VLGRIVAMAVKALRIRTGFLTPCICFPCAKTPNQRRFSMNVVHFNDWFRARSTPPDWRRGIARFSFPKSIPNTSVILENGRPMSKGRGSFLRAGWIF
jgi:hypothetical protein